MRVYVAGKTHDVHKVRAVQRIVRDLGGSITHDWTEAVENHGAEHENVQPTRQEAADYALCDLKGVISADLVIAVPHARWCGTLIEIGAAAAAKVPVLMLEEPHQRSVFWALPNVYMLRKTHLLYSVLDEVASSGIPVDEVLRTIPNAIVDAPVEGRPDPGALIRSGRGEGGVPFLGSA